MNSYINRKRIRKRLHAHTAYKNATEFFTALLLMYSHPPKSVLDSVAVGHKVYFHTKESWEWRQLVKNTINVTLRGSIDPDFVTQEYIKWLVRQRENKAMSKP